MLRIVKDCILQLKSTSKRMLFYVYSTQSAYYSFSFSIKMKVPSYQIKVIRHRDTLIIVIFEIWMYLNTHGGCRIFKAFVYSIIDYIHDPPPPPPHKDATMDVPDQCLQSRAHSLSFRQIIDEHYDNIHGILWSLWLETRRAGWLNLCSYRFQPT